MLRDAGYVTGHFGKWHLNALRGPGVPILETDDHNPGEFGFDHWLSVTNYFDRDPILSRLGKFEEFKGDSSEIVVEQALDFIGEQAAGDAPILAVIWYGTPHNPFKAADDDMAAFQELGRRIASTLWRAGRDGSQYRHASPGTSRTGNRRQYAGLVLQ